MSNTTEQVLVVALVLYFIPWIVAVMRAHHQATAIGVLNLFLGWTLLGWVGALVWAATEPRWRKEKAKDRRWTIRI